MERGEPFRRAFGTAHVRVLVLYANQLHRGAARSFIHISGYSLARSPCQFPRAARDTRHPAKSEETVLLNSQIRPVDSFSMLNDRDSPGCGPQWAPGSPARPLEPARLPWRNALLGAECVVKPACKHATQHGDAEKMSMRNTRDRVLFFLFSVQPL